MSNKTRTAVGHLIKVVIPVGLRLTLLQPGVYSCRVISSKVNRQGNLVVTLANPEKVRNR